jgi:bifunctional NMN adenylyltransferase/nudix hydrolase
MSKPSYGVIVGRFQINALHDGHIDLFQQVFAHHNRVIVFVGTSPAGMTKDHPLDFTTRQAMIRATFPDMDGLTIQPLEDCRTDEEWSAKLDAKIDEIVKFGEVTLYGGRDSFVPNYHGKFKPVELSLDLRKHEIRGTDIRREISNAVIASPDFRAGIIYAMNQLWPVMLQMVDVAILSYGRKEVLLARREHEIKWRFVGGHVEARKLTLEANARAEAMEEAGVDIIEQEYIGSCVINDWRYRQEDRSVMTAFFAGLVGNMSHKAGDDVYETRWFVIDKLKISDMIEEHVGLLAMLNLYLISREVQDATSIQAAPITQD